MPQAAPIMFALSAAQAASSIMQGYGANAEAKANASMIQSTGNYNASITEMRNTNIDVQKNISGGQYARYMGQTASKSTAIAGASGYALSGSSAAVLNDTLTQINIDNAITNFNYDQEKLYNTNAAESTRRQADMEAGAVRSKGRQAVSAGYTNAFSTMLRAGVSYGMYKGSGNLTTAGTPKNTTFDSTKMANTLIRGR